MSFPGKHFSKNDRKRKGVHVCSCGAPLSRSRIKKGIIFCSKCAVHKGKSYLGGDLLLV